MAQTLGPSIYTRIEATVGSGHLIHRSNETTSSLVTRDRKKLGIAVAVTGKRG